MIVLFTARLGKVPGRFNGGRPRWIKTQRPQRRHGGRRETEG
jgi:hypothetical protein